MAKDGRRRQGGWRGELEKLRSLSGKERREYLRMYYSVPLLIVCAVVAFAVLLGSFAFRQMRAALSEPPEQMSLAVICPGFDGCEAYLEGFRAQRPELDETVIQVLTGTGYSGANDGFSISLGIWMAAGQPDILICDEASLRYMDELEILAPLTDRLPAQALEGADGRLVTGRDGQVCAIDVTRSAFVRENGLERTPLYLCMFSGGIGGEPAAQLAEYILAGLE